MSFVVGSPKVISASGGVVPGVQRYARVYEQTEALNVWVIQHDLGYDPAGVTVTDEFGNVHHPLIQYPTPNSIIRLDFETPVRGVCRLS